MTVHSFINQAAKGAGMARQLDDEKKQRILESAFEAFGERGLANTTIKDIASHAGVAAGTVYTYFATKEEVFRAAVDAGWNRFHDDMAEMLETDEPFEVRINNLIDYGFDLLTRVHPILRGMFSDANRMDLLTHHVDVLCTGMERFFEQGRRSGVLVGSPNPRVRRFFLNSVVSGILLNISVAPPERLHDEVESIKTAVQEMMRESLVARAAAGGGV